MAVMHRTHDADRRRLDGAAGFSLIELLVSLAILMLVSATALGAVFNLTRTTGTVNNRTEMHAGVRNATELLQQEVGQSGRISFPTTTTLTAAIAVDATSFVVSDLTDIFVGQYLIVDVGGNIGCTVGCEEAVKVKTITAATSTILIETDAALTKGHVEFHYAHAAGVPIRVGGGFAHGVIPKTLAGGSGDFVLKIFGDIDGNGSMVYIQYDCDIATGNLYRRSVSYTAAAKPAVSADQSLLNNIIANPGGSPCFTYQEKTVSGVAFVTDVAITLTVQTAMRDPVSGLFQTETKALLNVSPRNVFNVWQMAGLNLGYRVQPTPLSVTNLMTLP